MAQPTFALIHHTHWDREWYLPEAAFRVRLVAAMGDLLVLLERNCDAHFVLDGQTILVEDVVAAIPAWRARLAALVRAGHLEVGPWYVLADEVIPAGESLVRNLLHGTADADALGGRMNVLHSPDAFGHPGALPMLAREFGIRFAVAWRGVPAMPGDGDLFPWSSPNGDEVLLYHLPKPGYEIGSVLAGSGASRAPAWRRIREELAERASSGQVALFVGADHHAPLEDPADLLSSLVELAPDTSVRFSALESYFRSAERSARSLRHLSGELRRSPGYTWSLQGVHGTRSRLKRRHTLVELALQRRGEVLAAMAWASPERRKALTLAPVVRSAWRELLRTQFHDTIAGCTSDLVAREHDGRLTRVQAIEREVTTQALHTLTGHDPDLARELPAGVSALIAWNPAARPRGGIVTATVTFFRRDLFVGPPTRREPRTGPGLIPFTLVAPNGASVPVQVLDVAAGIERVDARRHYPDQDAVDAVQIACELPVTGGLSTTVLQLVAGNDAPVERGLEASPGRIANRFLEILVADDGTVDLVDRRLGEHFRDVTQVVVEDDRGDSYTPWIENGSERRLVADRPRLVAAGPLAAVIAIDIADERAGLSGTVSLALFADSPFLRVRVTLDNQGIDHRVRIATPVASSDRVIAGAAFGHEVREAVATTTMRSDIETPLPTAPAHRFVLAGRSGRGMALLVPGFIEYEWREPILLQTVVRSIGALARDGLPTRPGAAGWHTPIPEAQEPGRHVHEFALAPIDEAEAESVAVVEAWWEDAFLAPQPTFVRRFTGEVHGESASIELEGAGLVFSTCKVAEREEAIVLRCYNTTDADVNGQWRITFPVAGAHTARADETRLARLAVGEDGSIAIVVRPRALSTVIVEPDYA